MNRDILRIKSLSKEERIGISLSSQYEKKTGKDYSNFEQNYIEEILNRSFSEEYALENVENLPDGDYPLALFREIPYAAHIVPDGHPTPVCTAKPLLMYLGDELT